MKKYQYLFSHDTIGNILRNSKKNFQLALNGLIFEITKHNDKFTNNYTNHTIYTVDISNDGKHKQHLKDDVEYTYFYGQDEQSIFAVNPKNSIVIKQDLITQRTTPVIQTSFLITVKYFKKLKQLFYLQSR
jgi:hypothetical protein